VINSDLIRDRFRQRFGAASTHEERWNLYRDIEIGAGEEAIDSPLSSCPKQRVSRM
jgi:hypothetical protein